MTELQKELMSEPQFHQEDLLMAVNDAITKYNAVHETTFALRHVDLVYAPKPEPLPEPIEGPIPFDDSEDEDICFGCGQPLDYCDCNEPKSECGSFTSDLTSAQYEDGFGDGFQEGFAQGFDAGDTTPTPPDYFMVGIETADPDVVAQAIMLLAPLGLAILTKPVYGDED